MYSRYRKNTRRKFIKLIDKEDVDLVVMASRGSEGHFDVGSVAQKLLQCSTIPIVTIPVTPEDRMI
jgi:nucleotide-binding universal stress UspA family protein